MIDSSRGLVVLGATGATGRRVAQLAVAAGLRPVLAGRDGVALERVAARAGLEYRVGGLDALDRLCDGAEVVVNCIGPYARFGDSVVASALALGANYVDFSAEPQWVSRMIEHYDGPARAAGRTLIPSVGLGSAAALGLAHIHADIGRPDDVTIGYRMRGYRPSRASLNSTTEMFARGAPIAEPGGIVYLPAGARGQRLPGGYGTLFPTPDPLLIAHTWPGTSVDCFMQMPFGRAMAPLARAGGIVLRRRRGSQVARALASRLGPSLLSAEASSKSAASVVIASAGGRRAGYFAEISDIYDFTAHAGLYAARALLGGANPGGVCGFGAVAGHLGTAERDLDVRVGRVLQP